ncbi:lipopolysaccharide kinase InaA family protein [Winogradskyella bathintestinalis]|uniref:Lipopolysaccharide kinase InaA family protein n=1 Tax=Winogradskyella bathintestinalis TaxID=3035208 RepID=A0ABT7ZXG7_9FLAO|nr:lipopolysaccharide kinase InaA family protein [Winogradskyella bathintestinalis]MDN3493433.1 lipopolysaccharide kinase InaA family protein [Winogradskyella bathintestinalis]
MKQTKNIHKNFKVHESFLDDIIVNFDSKGTDYGDQKRNSLKTFELQGKTLNVKSFRVPNVINKIAYNYFRKSKAQRSFEYAKKLQDLNIGTPQPIAYYEYNHLGLFDKSYYISEQLECDLTYRELINDFNYPDYDTILRAFTRFTYNLHEKGVQFLDHSPGNTLIKKIGDKYEFYLVDLNRMKFGTMDFETRMKNFSRLSKHKHMVEIMSDEYAKCCDKTYDEVFGLMWKEVKSFRESVQRKKNLKRRFKI